MGVHGRLYDITEFMHQHPGSPETLMDNAGADASEMFEDVGHSLDARDLMKSLNSLAPGPAAGSASSSRTSSYARASAGGAGGSGGAGSFDPRVGACLLSSTAQRMREGRALARREAKAVHLAAATGATAGAGAGTAASPGGVQEFVCEECERAFEPSDMDGDGEAGKERRAQCTTHCNGDLRVFYSPVRREWGGFYSCCRQHVCFCLPEGY